MPVGAFRDENGTPLTRKKQLAPNWYARQLAEEMRRENIRKNKVWNDSVGTYQNARRFRPLLGRDILTGIEFRPRQVIPPGWDITPRIKKPTVIVPEATTMFEAANDGIIGEPDTEQGLRDWDKYKKEPGAYKRIIRPDD